MKLSLKKVSQDQLELVKKLEYLRNTFRLRFYESITMSMMLFWLKHFPLADSKLVYASMMYGDMRRQAKKRGKR